MDICCLHEMAFVFSLLVLYGANFRSDYGYCHIVEKTMFWKLENEASIWLIWCVNNPNLQLGFINWRINHNHACIEDQNINSENVLID